MAKLRVGVLMGGRSIENEVSFNSGRTVCDHLDSSSYEVIPLFQKQNGDLFLLPWPFLYRGKISDFEHRLENEAKKISWDDFKKLIDFAILQCMEDTQKMVFCRACSNFSYPLFRFKNICQRIVYEQIFTENIFSCQWD